MAEDTPAKPSTLIPPASTQHYIKVNGNEIYAKDKIGFEYYAKNELGVEKYAINAADVQYYARTNFDSQYYAKDASHSEYYAQNQVDGQYYATDNSNHQILAKNDQNIEFYAKTENGDEYYPTPAKFARDEKRQQFYAKKSSGSEFYPQIHGTSSDMPIPGENGPWVYAKDAQNNEIYPTMDGHEKIYYDLDMIPVFAKNAEGDEITPKDANGMEYTNRPSRDVRHYPKDRYGNRRYLANNEGDSDYPTDKETGNQLYLLRDKNGKVIFAQDQSMNDIYAWKSNNDGTTYEYYPETGEIAFSRTGKPIYARDSSNRYFYPKDSESNEFYLKYEGNDFLPPHLSNYAKKADGTEIYPSSSKLGFRYENLYPRLGYAKDNRNRWYYPMDSNGNELFATDVYETPDGYPVASNNTIIIPEDNQGKPIFIDNALPVMVDLENEINVKNKLFRPHLNRFQDYSTNIPSGRKSRYVSPLTGFPPPPIKKGTNIWVILIIVIIFAILSVGIYVYTRN